MSVPVVWLPEADAELREAPGRYESISPELGQRFVEAVVDTIEKISAEPLRFAIVEKDRRRAGIRPFPYGIFFIIEGAQIVVIACFHGKRNPKHWQLR